MKNLTTQQNLGKYNQSILLIVFVHGTHICLLLYKCLPILECVTLLVQCIYYLLHQWEAARSSIFYYYYLFIFGFNNSDKSNIENIIINNGLPFSIKCFVLKAVWDSRGRKKYQYLSLKIFDGLFLEDLYLKASNRCSFFLAEYIF